MDVTVLLLPVILRLFSRVHLLALSLVLFLLRAVHLHRNIVGLRLGKYLALRLLRVKLLIVVEEQVQEICSFSWQIVSGANKTHSHRIVDDEAKLLDEKCIVIP